MLKRLIITTFVLLVVIIALILFGSKEIFNKSDYFTKSTNGLNVNSSIDFALPNQHNEIFALKNDTKKVIFVFSKPMGHIVKNYLANQPKNFLESKNILFVADISPMPVVIRNFVAMPDLKKSKYSVLLIFEPTLSKPLVDERNKDKIITVTLENKKITNIAYSTTKKEFLESIK